ncbi:hypothetical protein BH11PSE2_BH11PSE2_19680 [soil metagenome]
MAYQRPPPEYPGSFEHMPALPEIKGWTIRRLSLARKAVRFWCRACGRDVVITPTGLATIYRRRLDWTIEQAVAAAKCATCGANEAQASGHALEREDTRLSFVRREHAAAALKRNG